MYENTIFNKLRKADNLPQLPQVMLELIRACNNDKATVDELSRIVSTDPSLASRLIEIMGSSYYSLPKEVKSIKAAVVYLGVDTIRNIAISMSAMRFFNFVKPLEGFNLGRYWYHAYQSGIAAQRIAQELDLEEPEEFFLAGLLHDIGRLVLMNNFPEAYSAILSSTGTEAQMLSAETEKFEINTPQVSAWLFEKWNLNPLICDAVLFINEDAGQIESALSHVKVIWAANILADEKVADRQNRVSELTGISLARVEQMAEEICHEVDEMAKGLGINPDNVDDEETDKRLTGEIRNLSLFFGTMQNLLNARDAESVLEIAKEGLNILFNIPRVFYFLKDDNKNILTGFCSKKDRSHKIIKSIAVPLSNRTSLLVRCMEEQRVQNSLNLESDVKPAISDTQLIRLLGAQGLYCIPIYSSETISGVMALGVTPETAARLDNNLGLVRLFSKQTGVCLHSIRFHDEYARNIHDKKMEAYATLTDKVIHEVNNPVAIIKSYIETLSLKLPDKHPSQNELKIIGEEMSRVSELLNKLKRFSRPRIDGFERVDINRLCQDILEILKKSLLLPKQINAKLSIDPEIPMIKTDRNGLKQVFINLIKNAAEAMKDGGEIRVETRFLAESSKIMIDEKKRIPGNIQIIFSDDGPGIDDAVKDTLFEPYSTTKKGAETSGLGLSIVHSIIKELNGTITCESEKGRGTRFTITLPVSSSKRRI